MDRPVQVGIEVVMPRSNLDPALTAIAALDDGHPVTGNGPGALIAALASWGFEAELDFHSGAVWIEAFRGRYWQNGQLLFAALAPYAEGEIVVIAPDCTRWTYRLGDGVLRREDAA